MAQEVVEMKKPVGHSGKDLITTRGRPGVGDAFIDKLASPSPNEILKSASPVSFYCCLGEQYLTFKVIRHPPSSSCASFNCLSVGDRRWRHFIVSSSHFRTRTRNLVTTTTIRMFLHFINVFTICSLHLHIHTIGGLILIVFTVYSAHTRGRRIGSIAKCVLVSFRRKNDQTWMSPLLRLAEQCVQES